ncbi:uncharacterized protein LOC112053953 isoform X2 [Bicyclus anynana]|uniref:Uncharacterized protein LOC112053953 isoform X2 n=1 Tax=Bicyclus anynana TaxID=110368 RepID=A0A6J1P0Q1_BICAN|nr:uncharacterized protein LOC112053953 isoform X2 [Bicyclus anynana]
MPNSRFKPSAASVSSASDEASKLELYLQRQLEEDVARIFDESIYCDLEVVCGKLKILTHSCILKARTNIFYNKLEAILHFNIGKEVFDEIYSFISDAYTECDIKNQENEILIFLKSKIFNALSDSNQVKENTDDIEVYLTPNCTSPFAEKFQQITCLSPSTELTKEYYALVHIERNLLEQELIEQDALSNAFQTIIKSQDRKAHKDIQRNKPTSLSLISSHSSKTIKHSNNCDNYNELPNENTFVKNCEVISYEPIQSTKTCQSYKVFENNLSKTKEIVGEKVLDTTYSPDSLITDDPSSSSDYLSAAYTCSPALGSSGCFPQLNVGENCSKMENIFTSSDSGLENTGMLESLTSHKDVTLTDISLTESTLNDVTTEETNHSQGSISSPEADGLQIQKVIDDTGTSSLNGIKGAEGCNSQRNLCLGKQDDVKYSKTSKEEKQRQNEEIVILESSSVSSETGSWESVFPPKITDKEICIKFIHNERQYVKNHETFKNKPNYIDNQNNEKTLIKHSTPCFIDAASLADEEQISVQSSNINDIEGGISRPNLIPMPSKPVPCSTVNKQDNSPGDWSESNDNDDSLEQGDNKETDSIQKDLSPTIFEMTPITDDSLSANITVGNKTSSERNVVSRSESEKPASLASGTVYTVTTPHNSITSLKISSLKHYKSEESEADTIISKECYSNFSSGKYKECSSIVPDDTSIEDVYTPKYGIQSSSPLVLRKKENMSIVPGTSSSNEDDNNLPKISKSAYVSAWVVDMSHPKEIESDKSMLNYNCKKPCDRNCENLRKETKSIDKSRSSVESDTSEKSGHKFFIDLSTLPDTLPPEKPITDDNTNEKTNMFSMYIGLGENTSLKEMPSRLSSSINNKKQVTECKGSSKSKSPKSIVNERLSAITKEHDASFEKCDSSFEKYESLCEDPNISISEIISVAVSGCPKSINETEKFHETEKNKIEKPTLRRVNGDNYIKMNTVNVIHEETANTSDEAADLFVKLSDLDKPTIKSDIFKKESFDPRMTRSIPDNNWPEQSAQAASSRSSEVISSFHSENALSLNRLFPHLKNEFSKSMPISLSGRMYFRPRTTSSVGEIDEPVSDLSEISSIHSSICRSVIENSTTEETSQTSSLIGNCQSRLGQDLLRMFLEEIAPDVIVEASGKRIKAHKCILSSRCQYFAGILSGGWVESAGNVIVLPPFSFEVVHFALCHIYSGLSTIPDSISIVELATIADMLSLEGLKEAIMFTLKAKYCHHFHRPCQVCTAGVLECFPLSSVYGLDDLYRKCLRWITKYFAKVWPTKAFATLPKELLDKCYQEHIVNLSIENLIDTVYGCGLTVASLQNNRWSDSVARMCRRLVNAAAHFSAPRLLAILEMTSTVPDAPQPAQQALDDCLATAIEWAPPDETCRAYAYLSHLVKEIRSQYISKPDLITNGNQIYKLPEPNNILFTHATSWRLQCEGALVRAAPRVVGTQAFKDLPSDLRRRLRELGCIMYGPQAIPLTTSTPQEKIKNTYHNRPNRISNACNTQSLEMEKVRKSFVPYKPKPATVMGSKDKVTSNSELREIRKPNKVTAPKVRTTKAQEERAKFNQTKSLTTQECVGNNKHAPARPNLFGNTKPRYLGARLVKENEKKGSTKKFVYKVVSSSESSRNSSPVQCRHLRGSRMKVTQKGEQKPHVMSQDSLATNSRPRTAEPSTDSLSESQNSNRYATYTKTKHTSKGSVDFMSKYQGISPSSLINANIKTKIPVYMNQNSISANGSANKQVNKMKTGTNQANMKGKTKSCDRKVSGSLMNATKSSSAKIVPKLSKELQTSNSHSVKPIKQPKTGLKYTSRRDNGEREHHIPVMERSGTFLKDEPTFGDKTAAISIDKDL